ncbi:MAG: DUF4491 family protein [Coriobacteriia bacterium]
MHFEPIVIGLASFLIIGIFHPIVIKAEYHFSYKVWPLFLGAGLVLCAVSLFFYWSILVNTIIGIAGFSALWGIGEMFEQKKRVEKGWFPKNPKRKVPYAEEDGSYAEESK